MRPLTTLLLLMGLLSFLFGCEPAKSPFSKSDGAWLYNKTPIAGADAPTFTPLDNHYAKDRSRVFHADTYRKGQEYYTIKHDRIVEIAGADPASFTVMKLGYARDARRIYFEGEPFPVKDAASFELLDYGFARDRVSGYYHQGEVPGSAGGTFAALDTHYAKDASKVFYADLDSGSGAHALRTRSVVLQGAAPDSFKLLEGGYAVGTRHVYYRGAVVAGADAASFRMLEPSTAEADAQDANATYQRGERVAKVK
jgi:hypothetical protein